MSTQARQSVGCCGEPAYHPTSFFFSHKVAALSPIEIVSLGWYHYYTTLLLAGDNRDITITIPVRGDFIHPIRSSPSPTSPFVLSSSPSSFHLLALLLPFPHLSFPSLPCFITTSILVSTPPSSKLKSHSPQPHTHYFYRSGTEPIRIRATVRFLT